MIYSYHFSKDALAEWDEIITWYASRSIQATENFIAELDETIINKICRSPFSYRKAHQRFRVLKMKSYPYYIIYSVEEKTQLVVIAKLYHTSRNPENKYRHINE